MRLSTSSSLTTGTRPNVVLSVVCLFWMSAIRLYTNDRWAPLDFFGTLGICSNRSPIGWKSLETLIVSHRSAMVLRLIGAAEISTLSSIILMIFRLRRSFGLGASLRRRMKIKIWLDRNYGLITDTYPSASVVDSPSLHMFTTVSPR